MKKQNEELDDKQVVDLLVEVSKTHYWPAIVRYLSLRCIYVDNVLRTEDPVKNPAIVAREQGRRWGLLDLVDMVDVEVKRREAKEVEAEKKNADKKKG